MRSSVSASPPLLITPIRLEPRLVVLESDCCCPRAQRRCRPPYDLQPASLAGPPASLSPVQQAAVLLAGSVLEHLCAGRPALAAGHTERLAGLLDLL